MAAVPAVVAVARSATHSFSKPTVSSVELIEGVGVAGDAHSGPTVQHLHQVRKDADRPNLRQVHLIHAELLDALTAAGFDVGPGQLGENITTRGVDLLGLPVGTRLHVGTAVVTITGLRNPCHQIEEFRPGLLKQVLHRDDDSQVERLAGVMGIVSRSGTVREGDPITVELPAEPHHSLTTV